MGATSRTAVTWKNLGCVSVHPMMMHSFTCRHIPLIWHAYGHFCLYVMQIELNFFDAAHSSTAAAVSCSHPMCSSIVQTTAASCSSESNQCVYLFHYGDGSGTSGLYLSDLLHFDTILGPSLVANSSAPIVFGYSFYDLPNWRMSQFGLEVLICNLLKTFLE